MKVAWPTATCNLKRIIGPCHQYGHESLRAKLFYRAIKLYNCFRFFLGYIGHEKYFFRGHYILTYSFNQVLELAVTLCDPFLCGKPTWLSLRCMHVASIQLAKGYPLQKNWSIFLRRMYTLYDLCNLADAGTESMHQVWNSNLFTRARYKISRLCTCQTMWSWLFL